MPTPAALLPSQQHAHEGLPPLGELDLHRRREGVFLVLAGLFLGTLAMLNILGVTRFIKLFEYDFDPSTPGATAFAVAVGVLPYPITFLCTDFISELYGRKRANFVVWVGLLLNLWVVLILYIGGALPGFEGDGSAATRARELVAQLTGADPTDTSAIAHIESAVDRQPVFFEVRTLAFGAVTASMIAYLVAQLVDVQVFHFWKRLTRGKHLWLRNNGSTLVSQLVDTTAVILITYFYARALPVDEDSPIWPQLLVFIATGYVFKLLAAMLDTIPFYLGAPLLARFLRLPPPAYDAGHATGAGVEAGVG